MTVVRAKSTLISEIDRVQKLSDVKLAKYRNELASPATMPYWRHQLLAKVAVEYSRRGYGPADIIGD